MATFLKTANVLQRLTSLDISEMKTNKEGLVLKFRGSIVKGVPQTLEIQFNKQETEMLRRQFALT